MNKEDLINQVIEDLKQILYVPEDIEIKYCRSTSYGGLCDIKKKKTILFI